MSECRQWCVHLHIVYHEYLSLSLLSSTHISVRSSRQSCFMVYLFCSLFFRYYSCLSFTLFQSQFRIILMPPMKFSFDFVCWLTVGPFIEIQMGLSDCENMSSTTFGKVFYVHVINIISESFCIFAFVKDIIFASNLFYHSFYMMYDNWLWCENGNWNCGEKMRNKKCIIYAVSRESKKK